MPCDFTGVENHEHLTRKQGIQWPFPAGSPDSLDNDRRLFEDVKFFTADGHANFMFDIPRESVVQPVTEEYPIFLMNGRGSVAQFHSMTRTVSCPTLNKMWDPAKPYFEISAETALKYGIEDKDQVKISSNVGEFRAEAKITGIKNDCIFIPFHFKGMNNLTKVDLDSVSREPSFKSGAVKLEKIS